MRWIHININFINYDSHLNIVQYKELLIFLKGIIKDLEPEKKFFLFENTPHFFLACKIKKTKEIDFQEYLRAAPEFISELWSSESNDDSNSQLFIDMLNIMADQELSGDENYDFPHILHCILNQHKFSYADEILFHKVKVHQLKNFLVLEKLRKFHNYMCKIMDSIFRGRK